MRHVGGFLTCLLLIMGCVKTSAHPGGLDAQGCHTNRRTGDYHCHRSATPPVSIPKSENRLAYERERQRPAVDRLPYPEAVLLTRDGWCHAPSSPQYRTLIDVDFFPSMDACERAGRGRPYTAVGALPMKPVSASNASATPTTAPVKLSRSGICHAPSSQYYARTTNFTAYNSLDECLHAGGRLPR